MEIRGWHNHPRSLREISLPHELFWQQCLWYLLPYTEPPANLEFQNILVSSL